MFPRNVYNLLFPFNIVLLLIHSLGGASVDIATDCCLESQDLFPSAGLIFLFSTASRPSLGTNQFPMQ
jgi:hypothetical protein